MQKKTFLFIILSGIASFFNYALYPALARILSNEQFVSITVALAIFTQLSSFTLSIVAITIGLSKQKDSKDAKTTIEKLQAVITHLFLALLIIFLLFSPVIFNKISLSPSLLMPIILMLVLSIIMSVVSGYLNGKGKLAKLGISLVITSLLQLICCVLVGVLTKNGALTLYAMSLGTILSLTYIYTAYRADDLPNIASVFIHRLSIYRTKELRSLLKYVVFASISVLAINILLILDLLLISGRPQDAKVYADMYVVSRIVYFGGMLFLWPFLSNIDIYNLRKNLGLLLRICSVFVAITICSLSAMQLFGQQITHLLFGGQYQVWNDVKTLAILAILYKFNFLVITTLVMFFIVIRNRWAITLSAIASLSLGVFTLLYSTRTTSAELVQGLTVISFVVLLFGLYGFARVCNTKVTRSS